MLGIVVSSLGVWTIRRASSRRSTTAGKGMMDPRVVEDMISDVKTVTVRYETYELRRLLNMQDLNLRLVVDW